MSVLSFYIIQTSRRLVLATGLQYVISDQLPTSPKGFQYLRATTCGYTGVWNSTDDTRLSAIITVTLQYVISDQLPTSPKGFQYLRATTCGYTGVWNSTDDIRLSAINLTGYMGL